MKYRVYPKIINKLRRYYPQYKRDTETGWNFYPDNTPARMPVWFVTPAAADLYKTMMKLGDERS